jgi:hypothetical protein
VTRGPRLLVVDWDAFFPDPTMMPDGDPGDALFLYDWGHRETMFHIGSAWHTRAAQFLANGLDLPRCRDFETFFDRFDLSEIGIAPVAESNAVAGNVWPPTFDFEDEAWGEVWLVDAHHDCGYRGSYEQAEGNSCEDWMLRHHRAGSALHVRYPSWRGDADGALLDIEEGPLIDVDRRVGFDDMPQWFDALMICRSGAWVPSWCDDQFAAFIDSAGCATGWLGPGEIDRAFDMQQARQQAARQQAARQQAAAWAALTAD